ncbi:hypothetical protein OPQ81_011494 [Rhizoctonia solani]|nr:hypothetical protein OPQ81_011494 [Rhizoctonia solani]
MYLTFYVLPKSPRRICIRSSPATFRTLSALFVAPIATRYPLPENRNSEIIRTSQLPLPCPRGKSIACILLSRERFPLLGSKLSY